MKYFLDFLNKNLWSIALSISLSSEEKKESCSANDADDNYIVHLFWIEKNLNINHCYKWRDKTFKELHRSIRKISTVVRFVFKTIKKHHQEQFILRYWEFILFFILLSIRYYEIILIEERKSTSFFKKISSNLVQ
jgi:hypothetical protein